MTFAKPFFPDEVTVIGSRGWDADVSFGGPVRAIRLTLISSGVLSLPENCSVLAGVGICMLPQSEFRPEGQPPRQRRPRVTHRSDVRVSRERWGLHGEVLSLSGNLG